MKQAEGNAFAKVALISVILIVFIAFGVYAAANEYSAYTVIYSDGHQATVFSNGTTVEDILRDGQIIVNADEITFPPLDVNSDFTKTIIIKKATEVADEVAEDKIDVTKEEILSKYITITETIIVEQVEIPFETVTKDVSTSGNETTDRILQNGVNGIKELRYRVRYQNGVEINRELISEIVVQEPVEQIVQISNVVVSRAQASRINSSGLSLAESVEGLTPYETVWNASAYAGDTSTASGARPQAMYTVAAGPSIPFGTVVYIPYFENYPNGGWFVVQDRGGAIWDGRIDIYMSSESACNSFGRRNLTVYVYN